MRPELNYYRLSFPRDLSQDAVLAALASFSGVPHATRLVFELSATSVGITHQLGISPKATEGVLGNLRAAIPSLRLDKIDAPERVYVRRLLWQLTPASAVIRTNDLGAIAASLLASLFPLSGHETINLTWTVRPHLRPALAAVTSDTQRDGRLTALKAKLALPGLAAYGVLSVQAENSARLTQLTQRTAACLWSLSTPYGRLIPDSYWWGHLLRCCGQRGRYLSTPELAAVIGWPIDAPDLPGLEIGAAKRLVPSRSTCRP